MNYEYRFSKIDQFAITTNCIRYEYEISNIDQSTSTTDCMRYGYEISNIDQFTSTGRVMRNWSREISDMRIERVCKKQNHQIISKRSFTSFRMTVCIQDDLVRHAEPAKHLAMTEKSFTSFRMTDLVRIDGHAEPAKHLGVTVRSLALFRMTVIGLGQLIYNFMIVTVSPLIYSIQ